MKTESTILIGVFLFVFLAGCRAFADCPSADLTDDCFVDFEDLAMIGIQWLTTDPCVPDDMVYIRDGEFEMGRHVGDGYNNELPVHTVVLDAFFMSKFEITNQQYCDYLNAAYLAGLIKVDTGRVYASTDSTNSEPFFSTSSAPEGHPNYGEYSQIDYNDGDGSFTVRTKEGRDMSNDPVVVVSWYGAAAYCNWRSSEEGYEACYEADWDCNFAEHGYRLPTEAEWEYAGRGGEHSPYYRFPWGDTISHAQANYYANPGLYAYDVNPTSGYHPDWNDGNSPYTAPVGTFAANGYGLYDMTGNVREWCNDWYSSSYYITSPSDNPQGPASGDYRVLRGGSWFNDARDCRVAIRSYIWIYSRNRYDGFRVVLDPN